MRRAQGAAAQGESGVVGGGPAYSPCLSSRSSGESISGSARISWANRSASSWSASNCPYSSSASPAEMFRVTASTGSERGTTCTVDFGGRAKAEVSVRCRVCGRVARGEPGQRIANFCQAQQAARPQDRGCGERAKCGRCEHSLRRSTPFGGQAVASRPTRA